MCDWSAWRESPGLDPLDRIPLFAHEVYTMKSVRLLSALAVVLLVVLAAHSTRAGESEWKQWRGPNRDAKSTDTGLLKSWPAGGPKKLWEVDGIGNGYSSITLDGGLAYITGRKAHADEKIKYKEPPKHIW